MPNSVLRAVEMIKVETPQFLPGGVRFIRVILNLLSNFFPLICISLYILMIKISYF